MAYITINPSTIVGGYRMRTDLLGLDNVGGSKIVLGAEGIDEGYVGSANPMPVVAASLPLPSGAATEATLEDIDLDIEAILARQADGTAKTQVTNFPASQLVEVQARRSDETLVSLSTTVGRDLRVYASSSPISHTPDASTVGNHALFVGLLPSTLTPSPWGTAFGEALVFDGVDRGSSNACNQGLDCGVVLANFGGIGASAAFTFELLFVSTRGTANEVLINLDPLLMALIPGQALSVTIRDNLGVDRTVTSGVISIGKHSCAVTYDGATLRLFVDGSLVASTALSGISSAFPLSHLTIANRTANNLPFAGTIDEVRFSNVARYTATYVPATAAFALDANTLGLYHCDYVFGRVYSAARDDYDDQESLVDQAGAGAVLTFTFADARTCMAIVTSQGTGLVARASAGSADVPSATKGQPCFDSAPTYLPVRCGFVKVYAPTGTTISVVGLKRY